MRMGKQRGAQDKEALMDSDDSGQMTAFARQRGHTTETSDLSSDNDESAHSVNTEYSPKAKKWIAYKTGRTNEKNNVACFKALEAQRPSELGAKRAEIPRFPSVRHDHRS